MGNWIVHYEPYVVFGMLIVDLVMTTFIILEYYFGRPDIAVKNERNQNRRMKVKKDVIVYEKDMD